MMRQLPECRVGCWSFLALVDFGCNVSAWGNSQSYGLCSSYVQHLHIESCAQYTRRLATHGSCGRPTLRTAMKRRFFTNSDAAQLPPAIRSGIERHKRPQLPDVGRAIGKSWYTTFGLALAAGQLVCLSAGTSLSKSSRWRLLSCSKLTVVGRYTRQGGVHALE